MVSMLIELNSHQKFILRHLRVNDRATRTTLAEHLAMSNQTLTRLSKALIDNALVEPVSKIEGKRGQPAIYLSLVPNQLFSAGIVLSNHQVQVRLEDLSAKTVDEISESVSLANPVECMRTALDGLAKLSKKHKASNSIVGIGVAVSGFFQMSGKLCNKHNLEGWENTDIAQMVTSRFNTPCYVENDGNAAAAGFALSSSAKGVESAFVFSLGEGIGGGFFHNGNMVRGYMGNAGEVAGLFSPHIEDVKPSLSSLHYFAEEHGLSIDTLSQQEGLSETYNVWINQAAASFSKPLYVIQCLLDPQVIVLSGDMDMALRQALVSNLEFSSLHYRDVDAPKAKVIVDEQPQPMATGACGLAWQHFLA